MKEYINKNIYQKLLYKYNIIIIIIRLNKIHLTKYYYYFSLFLENNINHYYYYFSNMFCHINRGIFS